MYIFFFKCKTFYDIFFTLTNLYCNKETSLLSDAKWFMENSNNENFDPETSEVEPEVSVSKNDESDDSIELISIIKPTYPLKKNLKIQDFHQDTDSDDESLCLQIQDIDYSEKFGNIF